MGGAIQNSEESFFPGMRFGSSGRALKVWGKVENRPSAGVGPLVSLMTLCLAFMVSEMGE